VKKIFKHFKSLLKCVISGIREQISKRDSKKGGGGRTGNVGNTNENTRWNKKGTERTIGKERVG
jgi:hypothetical protein